MMHSAEQIVFNTFTHNQAEQIKQSIFYQNFVRKTLDLNTAQSISWLNNFITHCLGHSKLL